MRRVILPVAARGLINPGRPVPNMGGSSLSHSDSLGVWDSGSVSRFRDFDLDLRLNLPDFPRRRGISTGLSAWSVVADSAGCLGRSVGERSLSCSSPGCCGGSGVTAAELLLVEAGMLNFSYL